MQITETMRANKVNIGFTVTDGSLTFMDIIDLPKEQFDMMSEAQITAMKQKKYSDWVLALNTSPPPDTVESLTVQIAFVDRELLKLDKYKKILKDKLDSIKGK